MDSPLTLGNLVIKPVPIMHGILDILGFVIEETGRRVVYLTDVNAIPPDSFGIIENPDLLIIGALRIQEHSTHFNFNQAMEVSLRINAGQTLLTHICHNTSHEEITAYCREFLEKRNSALKIVPAFDGQVLVI